MTIQASSNPLDNMLLQILGQRPQTAETSTPPLKQTKKQQGQDIVVLSGKKPEETAPLNQKQSKLISEDIQDTKNGFRRTQEFENASGKNFTRIEEFSTTLNRSKRIVIQQNDSGSITALENVIDRQDDGSFRLIQRYTDEAGVTKTNVTHNFNPIDANVLLGRPPAQTSRQDNPFQTIRGTQVDLSI